MQSVAGALAVTADANTKTALVTYEDTLTDIAAIAAASAAAGYEAMVIQGGF